LSEDREEKDTGDDIAYDMPSPMYDMPSPSVYEKPFGKYVMPQGRDDAPHGEYVMPQGRHDAPHGEYVMPQGKDDEIDPD
jgi:hypothetical protein